MIHLRKRYCDQDPVCEDDDEFIDCNLSQLKPETEICSGRTGLRFLRCNLSNCLLPEDSVTEKCLTVQVERDAVVEVVSVDGIKYEVAQNVVVGRRVK